jgi:hypothetical protein
MQRPVMPELIVVATCILVSSELEPHLQRHVIYFHLGSSQQRQARAITSVVRRMLRKKVITPRIAQTIESCELLPIAYVTSRPRRRRDQKGKRNKDKPAE